VSVELSRPTFERANEDRLAVSNPSERAAGSSFLALSHAGLVIHESSERWEEDGSSSRVCRVT
jgi:hypothetical protein